MTSDVRLGIVGLGNIGRQHLSFVMGGDVTRARVVATCSPRSPDFDKLVPDRHTSDTPRHFSDLDSLIAAKVCDALVIATPTFEHARMGAAAVAAGLHVMMEKPLARSAYEARRWIDHAPDRVCVAVMLNQRVHPDYVAIRSLLQSSAIGDLCRVSWTMTQWYRPDVYFKVSPWRGTWIGEGGGALLNQCIHNLDILQWLVGMPLDVTARCGFGRYHDIEVEDEVSALMTFPGAGGTANASGTVVASTGESPGTNELVLVGDAGTIRYDGVRVTLTRNDPPVSEHSASTLEMFGSPAHSVRQVDVAHGVNQHAVLLQNFVDAILDGDPLIAPASDGLASLDLANAILMSAWLGESVTLPVDREAYQALLNERIAQSRFRVPENLAATIDMQQSYR